jgi:cell division protein FtsB
MSAARSYSVGDVITPRSAPQPDRPDEDLLDPDVEAAVGPAASNESVEAIREAIDLSSLTVAGITRRRVGWLAAGLISAWIVVIFARQASEAANASNRADEIARENAALSAEVASLERELTIIGRPEYIAQQGRAYRVGTPNEIPFTLDPSVPDPGPDAPGSAGLRVGADADRRTPLESWLSLLFGPTD